VTVEDTEYKILQLLVPVEIWHEEEFIIELELPSIVLVVPPAIKLLVPELIAFPFPHTIALTGVVTGVIREEEI
jgi:hypothetical protein